MTCVKTGARVRLSEYNCTMNADIHYVGEDIVVVNGNFAAADYAADAPFDATLRSSGHGDHCWWPHKGIFVVPMENFTWEEE